jgi:hypothetical protein
VSPELRSVLLALGQAIVEAAGAGMEPDGPGPVTAGSDRWLTPAEAAQRLGVTPRWLTRRWRSLPFCHALPQGRGYRVSERALARSMAARRS